MTNLQEGDWVMVRQPEPGQPHHTLGDRSFDHECAPGSIGRINERRGAMGSLRVRFAVTWEEHPEGFDSKVGDYSVIDADCLMPAQPTDQEMDEVYRSLGAHC